MKEKIKTHAMDCLESYFDGITSRNYIRSIERVILSAAETETGKKRVLKEQQNIDCIIDILVFAEVLAKVRETEIYEAEGMDTREIKYSKMYLDISNKVSA